MDNINKQLTIIYVTIQLSIALFVSVIGATHVRRSIQTHTPAKAPNSNIDGTPECSDDIDEQKETGSKPLSDVDTKMTMKIDRQPDNIELLKHKGFCELWIKIAWKMRSVYSSLAVHSFDVATDVLVIVQWMNTPTEAVDHVDPQTMAYSAI
eukprot:268071_1